MAPADVAHRFPRAALATPHYLASAAGGEVLASGGNAIDAAVAANLVLGVVAPYFCGVGGDLFAMVWDGALSGYLGAGRAPAAATPDALIAATDAAEVPPAYRPLERGNRAPGIGPHSVTVPQAVEGWFTLLDRWGTRSFGELARSAIGYARDGFEVTATAAEVLRGCQAIYGRLFPAWREVYGECEAGTRLRQPALARLLELLASDGPEAFYSGPVADAIAAAVRAEGGLLDSGDLAAHAGEWCTPMQARYRDTDVAELPPPTQGITALEILRILDGFELGAADPVQRQHLTIEATKLALADRDQHVGDPDHQRLAPASLVAEGFVASRRQAIDPARASDPRRGLSHVGGTAYLCAADADGLLVSLIQSNFYAFGSGVHVAEWGINLHNRGASFSLDPSSVNVLAPRKRPMHTLIPAMALRDAQPWLVFGSMGGDAQAQIHPQLLGGRVDDGADVQAAIGAPRWRVDPHGWQLRIESRADASVIEGLRSLGHAVHVTPAYDTGMGHAHAIELTAHGYAVATDPRAEGAAVGH